MINTNKSTPVYIALSLSLMFSVYLALTTQMIIVQDALNFEINAKIIYNQGWVEFIKTGPHREPLFSYLIAIAMKVSESLNLTYQDVMRVFQVLALFITQLLTLRILKKLQTNAVWICFALLLIGFAPAMLNTVFDLYSEIMVCPLILTVVLLLSDSWGHLQSTQSGEIKLKRILLPSFSLGIIFSFIIFLKGIFEFIAPLLLIPFLLIAVFALKNKDRKRLIALLVFIIVVFTTYSLPLHMYKAANKKYNGSYVLTNRGAYMLYGNTSRHMEAFSLERVLVALTCSMGASQQRLCHKLFGEEACSFWDFRNSDAYAHAKMNELKKQGFSEGEMNSELIKLSLKKIIKNPFQYSVFYAMEALSVIFFKSAEIAYVAYPAWLSQIYKNELFRYVMSFFTAFLSFVSLIYLAISNWKMRKVMWTHWPQSDEKATILFSNLLSACRIYRAARADFRADEIRPAPSAAFDHFNVLFFTVCEKEVQTRTLKVRNDEGIAEEF